MNKGCRIKFTAMAVCLTVAVGMFAVGCSPDKENINNPDGTSQVINGIVQVKSLQELSDKVKFDVSELSYLPFPVETTEYFSYWDEMAQIVYSDGENKITFRQSKGIDDNSGDYNDYALNEFITMGDIKVMVRGHDSDNCIIASWTSADMSYSITADGGIPMEEIKNILLGIA